MERVFWKMVKILWYSAMLFLAGLALVLMDKSAYLISYVAMGVSVVMVWISVIANTKWSGPCGK